MAGITPNEGEHVIAQLIYAQDATDRDADLELGLFTNSSVSETTALSAITEPTGGGYARKTLTDGSWTITADTATYASQTFTASGSNYTGSVYGYFIATKSASGTPRLLHIEVDSSGPYTITDGDSYQIDLSNVVA